MYISFVHEEVPIYIYIYIYAYDGHRKMINYGLREPKVEYGEVNSIVIVV